VLRVRGLFDTYLPGRTRYPLEVPVLLGQLAAEGVTNARTLPYAHRPGVASWLNDETAALRDRWADLRLPVVLHAGHDPLGRTEQAHLRGLPAVADRHPRSRWSSPTAGIPPSTRRSGCSPPTRTCTPTSPPSWPTPSRSRHRTRPASRTGCRFGSDAPNTGVRVTELLERLRAGGLRDDALAAITHANAERLVAGATATPAKASGEPASPEQQERGCS
jgi:hypothetical protein